MKFSCCCTFADQDSSTISTLLYFIFLVRANNRANQIDGGQLP
jgi:hypothetical protein